MGYAAGSGLGAASQNTFIGEGAGYSVNIGESNACLGYNTMFLSTEGDYCVAIGREALAGGAMTADHNIAIGYKALFDATDPGGGNGNNTFVGGYAGQDITTGADNTGIGFNAGGTLTTGDYNVCLGRYAGHNQVSTGDKELWIANDNVGSGNVKCWIHGNSSGACYQGNNSSTWSTGSDRRLKKNIVDNTKGLAEIKQLRAVSYTHLTLPTILLV